MKARWSQAMLVVVVVALAAACSPGRSRQEPMAKAEPAPPPRPVSERLQPREQLVIEVLTVDDRARLCHQPSCDEGQHLARIPTGTKLDALNEREIRTGGTVIRSVRWFQVEYDGKQGWVSEFDTDQARNVGGG